MVRALIAAFVAGVVVLQTRAELPSAWWAGTLPVLTTAAALGLRRPIPRLASLLALCSACATGFAWAALIAGWRLAESLPAEWEGRDLLVTGVIVTMPEISAQSQRFDFAVEQVEPAAAVVPHSISLAWGTGMIGADDPSRTRRRSKSAAVSADPPQVHAGERWRLVVRLKRPHGNANPGAFDYEAWLLERGVRANGSVRSQADNRRLDPMVWRPGTAIERVRETIRARFARVLGDAPYRAVLVALVVGDQSGIAPAQWNVFWRTGVGHLISISGLHITLVAALCAFAVRRAWLLSPTLCMRLPARHVAALAGMSAALCYALLAGFSVPTQRTLFMLGTVAWATCWRSGTSSSRVLAAALFATVVLDPWAPLEPGFWLSFGAVGSILYAATCRSGHTHWFAEALRTQWAVTLALAPPLAFMFSQVSLISPVANAFAIPLVGNVVVPLALVGALPGFGWTLQIGHWLFGLCMIPLEALSAPAWASWSPASPGWWGLCSSLVGVTWMLAPRGFPGRAVASTLLLPLVLPAQAALAHGTFRITVLDIGQGLATLVETRHHVLLFDTGPPYGPAVDAGSRVVVPYLRAAGIAHLDGMIVSHKDSDHSGGALSVLDAVDVGWLASSLGPDHRVARRAHRAMPCFAGQVFEWDGVRFDMLHPAAEAYASPEQPTNAMSCTLMVSGRYGRALLPADVEADSEEQILERAAAAEAADEHRSEPPGTAAASDVAGTAQGRSATDTNALGVTRLRADLILAPHHGSTTSSTPAFVAAIRPAWVIYSAGYRNRFSHPRPQVVERYAAIGARALRTDRDGAVIAEFDRADGPRVRAWRTEHRRYWYEPGG